MGEDVKLRTPDETESGPVSDRHERDPLDHWHLHKPSPHRHLGGDLDHGHDDDVFPSDEKQDVVPVATIVMDGCRQSWDLSRKDHREGFVAELVAFFDPKLPTDHFQGIGVEYGAMTRQEFDALPEFPGW